MTNDQQRTPEWFEQERGRITASAVGAILGLSPHTTRGQMLRRMVRETLNAPSEFELNIATEYGTNNRTFALMDFEMETGLSVAPCGLYTIEADNVFISARPIGLVGNNAIIEVKCPFGIRNDKPPVFKTPEEQPHYVAQMQFQMMVAGSDLCHFFQWTTHGNRHDIIEADVNWWARNKDAILAFWSDYKQALADPEDHLAPLRREIDTPEAAKLISEYDDCLEQEERAKERKGEIMERLQELAKGQNALVCGRKLTKQERAGSIFYAKVVKDWAATVDLEPYRGKSSTFWTLK